MVRSLVLPSQASWLPSSQTLVVGGDSASGDDVDTFFFLRSLGKNAKIFSS
jgi:hypothetical protein